MSREKIKNRERVDFPLFKKGVSYDS